MRRVASEATADPLPAGGAGEINEKAPDAIASGAFSLA
jgi:hypothetical protein